VERGVCGFAPSRGLGRQRGRKREGVGSKVPLPSAFLGSREKLNHMWSVRGMMASHERRKSSCRQRSITLAAIFVRHDIHVSFAQLVPDDGGGERTPFPISNTFPHPRDFDSEAAHQRVMKVNPRTTRHASNSTKFENVTKAERNGTLFSDPHRAFLIAALRCIVDPLKLIGFYYYNINNETCQTNKQPVGSGAVFQ
jgi:hypothetical protein